MLKPIQMLLRFVRKPEVVKKIPGLRIDSKKAIFDREITKSKNQVPTKRSAELILGEHELTVFELKDKRVLDVGSGDSSFVNYLKEKNIDAKSLDPSRWLFEKPDYPIAVEELSEIDKFDIITCNYSFFYHSNSSLMIRIGFYKMLRSLKRNGFISIVPFVTVKDIKFFNDVRLIKILESCGFIVIKKKEGIRIYKKFNSNLKKLKNLFGLQALPN